MSKLYQLYRIINNEDKVIAIGYFPFAGKHFINRINEDLKSKKIEIKEEIKRYDFALTEEKLKEFDGTLPKDCNNWIPFHETGVNALALLPGHENLLKHYGYTLRNNYIHNLFGYPRFMVNIYWEDFEKENKSLEKNGQTLYSYIRNMAKEDRELRKKNTIFDKRNIWVVTGRYGEKVQLLRFITEVGPNFDKTKIEKEFFDMLQKQANEAKNPLIRADEIKLINVYTLESDNFSKMHSIIKRLEELFQVSEPTNTTNEEVEEIAQDIYEKMESVMKIAYTK